MAEAEKQVQAEREALEASETAKTTAREERFFKVNKAMEEVAACTSTGQMYELMVKTVREQSSASNVYLMILEQTPPPEGQEEDPEPEQEAPPEVAEGEEPPPPPEKLDPWLPKFTTLRCIAANEENAWMVGKTIQSPAYGKETVSYATVQAKEPTFLKNVMDAEPEIVFFDMPMPGSFSAQPVLKGEDAKYKAGGVLGLLCADTIGSSAQMSDDDKEIFDMMGRTAGSTYERLMEEARQRKEAEDAAVAELFEALVVTEEQAMTEEDEVDALETKLDALDKELVAKVKEAIKAECPAAKEGEFGRSVAELVSLPDDAGASKGAASALLKLIGAADDAAAADVEDKVAAFDVKTCSEEVYDAVAACLAPEGADAITKDSAGIIFPAQMGLALVSVAQLLKDMTVKIQKVRAEEAAAKAAEEEAAKAAEEAAAAEAAAAAAAEAAPAEGA